MIPPKDIHFEDNLLASLVGFGAELADAGQFDGVGVLQATVDGDAHGVQGVQGVAVAFETFGAGVLESVHLGVVGVLATKTTLAPETASCSRNMPGANGLRPCDDEPLRAR